MSESEYKRIYGRNPVREAIKSGRNINRIMLAEGNTDYALANIAKQAKERGISVQYTNRHKLDLATGGQSHQGVVAYVSPVAFIEPLELLEIAKERGEKPFIAILDSITDPYNTGAIIRSAYCAGCHGVIIPKRRSSAITEIVEKASAGTAQLLAIAQAPNLNQAVEELKKRGVFVVAADKGGSHYAEIDYDMPLAVVIGSEGSGISKLLKSKCDFIATIPMKGSIDSLNCSVAAGIILFEAAKQRGASMLLQ
ncbi:MAG: 23S rRNA (guanosine(2251)-2'-O)-methyltransferase RlmB [Eubacteriaceae bacterium]|nr:23S rRNA (guanosine(2251)-2'-O)-methyltransferase RlmB [Eubacteriaceae bacterium]